MSKHILYLHGFNSSPSSVKAQFTQQYFAKNYPEVNFHCPQIANSPEAAVSQLNEIINDILCTDESAQWYFIGSSLGGFFSTYLAEKYQRPAILINPAVKPYQLLTEYLGDQVNPYTNEAYKVTVNFIETLKRLEQDEIMKNNYLLMVQTGDEVLDYRQAINFYQDAKIITQQGGDHSFVGYEQMLPEMASFFHFTEPNQVEIIHNA